MAGGNIPITPSWYFFLFTLVGACCGLLYTVFQGDGEPLVASLGFSGIAFAATYCLICWLGDEFKRVGLKGKDIGKTDKRELWASLERHCLHRAALIAN
jgi:UDP-N-acetylglucosamine--dolichyl-phosphate N-acetylglucosaminephosphotransferase